MAKKRVVQWVTHPELRTLVDHLSTLIAAQDVRIAELERVLPVDPEVRVAAAAFVRANNGPMPVLVR